MTSLEDALNRYAEPNTIMVYRHQDEKFEYEVMTDMQGKKTYKTLALSEYSGVEPQKNDGGVIISIETIDALDKRISALESELLKKANKKGNTPGMMNPMQMIGRQVMGNIVQDNPIAMLMQMKQSGMTPQQAYEQLMRNPQFVQSVNVARQQYPNLSAQEIARQNGYDVQSMFGNI